MKIKLEETRVFFGARVSFFIGFWRRIYRELAEVCADKHGISKTFIWINEMRLCGQTEMSVWINVARSSGWTGMSIGINERRRKAYPLHFSVFLIIYACVIIL